ncbi:hypothetical protein RHMOL_Rhmol09G0117500 [Rhododendron molle]|uniref:Uncharacterized protein n=1 Tax=Rhododendron molle TaxID=49168 RepID=A0ACC0MCB5_RHOML|nr:hypothetical protein RHMOL_Rhmol09G0117500 [Rhododendron molle]
MPHLQITDHHRRRHCCTLMSFKPQLLVSISNAHEGLDHHGCHTPTKVSPSISNFAAAKFVVSRKEV